MPRFRQLSWLLVGCTLACSAQTPANNVNHSTNWVVVRSLGFDDTVGLPNPVARYVERAITGSTYGEDYKATIEEEVRDAFQRIGYFKVAVEAPGRFTTVSHHNGKRVIDAHVIVVPGPRYTLESISFRGTNAFPATMLRQQFPIKKGDVFDIEKIRIGIENMKDLYCRKGFINFTPVPDFTFDEADKRMSMKVDVDEGAPYRVGKLTIQGDKSLVDARQPMLAAWKKYEGSQYVCDPVEWPVERLLTDLHACRDAREPKVEIVQDDVNHVINYALTLIKPVSAPAACTPR